MKRPLLIYPLVIGLLTACSYLWPVWQYGLFGAYDNSDLTKHMGILHALHAKPFFPENPFLYQDQPLNYYLGFYYLPWALHHLSFGLLDLYMALTLAAVIVNMLFVRVGLGWLVREGVKGRAIHAVALTFLSVPGGHALVQGLKGGLVALWAQGPWEFWQSPNVLYFASPLFSFLFYPQHVASACVLLLAFWLKGHSKQKSSMLLQAGLIIYATFCSYFIATISILAYAVLTIFELSVKKMRTTVWLRWDAGVILGVIFSSLFLLYPASRHADPSLSGLALRLAPRVFLGESMWEAWLDRILIVLLNFAWLPLLALVGGALLPSMLQPRMRHALWGLVGVALVVSLTLRAGLVINDVSAKASFLIWMGLCALCVPGVVATRIRWVRGLGVGMLALSILGGLQLMIWRVSPQNYLELPPDYQEAHQWLRDNVPTSRVVQKPLARKTDPSFPYYTGHHTYVSDYDHARVFAPSQEAYEGRVQEVMAVFTQEDPTQALKIVCQLPIDYLWITQASLTQYPAARGLLDPQLTQLAFGNASVSIVKPRCRHSP